MRRPRLPAVLALVVLITALVVTVFAWPAARLDPRDLPVGIVDGPAGGLVEQQLAGMDREFDLHRYPDADAARQAIRDRDVYGAFVAAEPLVLTAPAASPAVAQLLERTIDSQGGVARVEQVVPAPAGDPRGTGLAAFVLPLAVAGVMTGVAAALTARSPLRRAGLVAAGALLAGLAATAIVQGWLGVVEGGWSVTWAVLSLSIFAVGCVVAGLEALLGRPGVGLGAAVMVIVGNATSAVASAPQMLPEPMGALGQLLPPGASASLVRSTSFFDGSAAAEHAAVLAGWAVLGLVVLGFGQLAQTRRSKVPMPDHIGGGHDGDAPYCRARVDSLPG